MKDKYFVKMGLETVSRLLQCKAWRWRVVCINGVTILKSKDYDNKANCRNVSQNYANNLGLRWREA